MDVKEQIILTTSGILVAIIAAFLTYFLSLFQEKKKGEELYFKTFEIIEALDIYWYETFDKNHADIPASVEGIIMQRRLDIFGTLPKWNKEF